MTQILCFDTESTGVNTRKDRIVTAFLGLMDDSGEFSRKAEWLVDPGIEIPEAASAVHGISTERAQAEGSKDLAAVFTEIRNIIQHECITNGVPLVIFNAPYDLTILLEECLRNDVEPLDIDKLFVIDPLVVDKGLNPFRKGSRKLTDMAPHYGVPVESNAHDAGADCLMTGRIALKQLPKLKGSREDLINQQTNWKASQAASLQAYFRRKDPSAVVDPGWPLQTAGAGA